MTARPPDDAAGRRSRALRQAQESPDFRRFGDLRRDAAPRLRDRQQAKGLRRDQGSCWRGRFKWACSGSIHRGAAEDQAALSQLRPLVHVELSALPVRPPIGVRWCFTARRLLSGQDMGRVYTIRLRPHARIPPCGHDPRAAGRDRRRDLRFSRNQRCVGRSRRRRQGGGLHGRSARHALGRACS